MGQNICLQNLIFWSLRPTDSLNLKLKIIFLLYIEERHISQQLVDSMAWSFTLCSHIQGCAHCAVRFVISPYKSEKIRHKNTTTWYYINTIPFGRQIMINEVTAAVACPAHSVHLRPNLSIVKMEAKTPGIIHAPENTKIEYA